MVFSKTTRMAWAVCAACAMALLLGWGTLAVPPAHADELEAGTSAESSESSESSDAAGSAESEESEETTLSNVDGSIYVQFGQTEARTMLDMVNEFRQGEDAWAWNEDNTEQVYATDLQPLAYDYGLEQSAMQRAAEIALRFSHVRPDGYSFYNVPNYKPQAENIAGAQLSALEAFESWREDDRDYSYQGNRRNMLGADYKTVGVGHVYVNGYDYWTMEFSASESGVEETEANDGVELVAMEIDPSTLTQNDVSVDPDSFVLHLGETASLPEVSSEMVMSSTWPGYPVHVIIDAHEWTIDDTAVAAIEDGAIVPKGLGETTLRTTLGSGEKLALPVAVKRYEMHRLYNPNSGEHFYTANESEYLGVVDAGWDDEGVGWTAPDPGEQNVPVYRLYNPYAGEHHYTLYESERDALVEAGWDYEGIGWYSDPDKSVPLYREYNPYMFSCNHNYTTDKSEHDGLVALGWADEGIAWYGVA